jgi:hypothetical protein
MVGDRVLILTISSAHRRDKSFITQANTNGDPAVYYRRFSGRLWCRIATMPFTTLTDDQEKELYRLQRLYWREALRCEDSKAYLAGCVVVGSALETLLIHDQHLCR